MGGRSAAGVDGCPRADADLQALAQANLIRECLFSLFNGVFMGMTLFAAPIIAVTALEADYLEITIIACAFPCGAFLGPLWVGLGRRWGMQKLVTQMALWANLPLFGMFWVQDAPWFTALIALSQLLHSAMRMGQSSMYRITYPRGQAGRALGRIIFCSFATLVPTVLLAGWLTKHDPASYQFLFPLSAVSGLIGCRFYALLRPLAALTPPEPQTLRSRLGSVRRVVVRDRAYMLFQLAFFLSGTSFFMSNHVVLMLAHDVLGFDAQQLALWLSALPQVLLALTSLVWGGVMDKIGIVRARMLISLIMTVYLASYFSALATGWAALVYLGSVLRGLSEGGGQVTWALTSSHFAPRSEDVPLYNGIHFMLNGVRGLVMPWLGSLLFLLTGPGTVLLATFLSACSIPVIGWSLRYGDRPEEEAHPDPLAVATPEPAAEVG